MTVFNFLKDTTLAIYSTVVQLCQALYGFIKTTSTALWKVLQDFMNGIYNGIVKPAYGLFLGLIKVIQDFYLYSLVPMLIGVKNLFLDLGQAIYQLILKLTKSD